MGSPVTSQCPNRVSVIVMPPLAAALGTLVLPPLSSSGVSSVCSEGLLSRNYVIGREAATGRVGEGEAAHWRLLSGEGPAVRAW